MNLDIGQIVLIAIITTILSVSISRYNSEISLLVGVIGGVIILMMVIPQLTVVFDTVKRLGDQVDIDSDYIVIILKVIGVSYMSEFGIQICKDADRNALASKIEMAGKVLIMGLAIPIILNVVDTVTSLL